jgi:hypothetical protein
MGGFDNGTSVMAGTYPASNYIYIGMPFGVSGNAVVRFDVVFQGRVTSTSGTTESVGDTCNIEFPVVVNVQSSGADLVVHSGTPVVTGYNVSGSGTMSTVVISLNPHLGTILLTIGNGSLDPTTVMDYAVYLEGMVAT